MSAYSAPRRSLLPRPPPAARSAPRRDPAPRQALGWRAAAGAPAMPRPSPDGPGDHGDRRRRRGTPWRCDPHGRGVRIPRRRRPPAQGRRPGRGFRDLRRDSQPGSGAGPLGGRATSRAAPGRPQDDRRSVRGRERRRDRKPRAGAAGRRRHPPPTARPPHRAPRAGPRRRGPPPSRPRRRTAPSGGDRGRARRPPRRRRSPGAEIALDHPLAASLQPRLGERRAPAREPRLVQHVAAQAGDVADAPVPARGEVAHREPRGSMVVHRDRGRARPRHPLAGHDDRRARRPVQGAARPRTVERHQPAASPPSRYRASAAPGLGSAWVSAASRPKPGGASAAVSPARICGKNGSARFGSSATTEPVRPLRGFLAATLAGSRPRAPPP